MFVGSRIYKPSMTIAEVARHYTATEPGLNIRLHIRLRPEKTKKTASIIAPPRLNHLARPVAATKRGRFGWPRAVTVQLSALSLRCYFSNFSAFRGEVTDKEFILI